MTARSRWFAKASLCCALFAAVPAQAQFTSVALPTTNFSTASLYSALPTGNVTFLGVPFTIGSDAGGVFNTWHSEFASGANPRTLTLTPNVFGVTEVYTLINTYWGQPGPTSYAALSFTGSGGATFVKSLVGNTDVRDYLNNTWTNGINGTTTRNAYSEGSVRLDMQRIVLPAEFATQTLASITLSDAGANTFQRSFVVGATVLAPTATVPEPATCVLVGTGLTGIGLLARRRRRA